MKKESTNPLFSREKLQEYQGAQENVTVWSFVSKIIVGFFFLGVAAYFGFTRALANEISFGLFIGCLIGACIAVLIASFVPKLSAPLTIVYAALEGFAIGGLSGLYHIQYDGLPITALIATASVILVMWILYAFRIIKVTDRLVSTIIGATASIFFIYLITLIIGLFGGSTAWVTGNGPIAIGFGIIVVFVAAFNILLDFRFMDDAIQHQLPRHMQWYITLGFMVSVVWLYIEILDLLRKLRD